MKEQVRSDSIAFCHKQTWCGIVLMIRDAVCADGIGVFEWSKWRKANYYEYEIYMQRAKQ